MHAVSSTYVVCKQLYIVRLLLVLVQIGRDMYKRTYNVAINVVLQPLNKT